MIFQKRQKDYKNLTKEEIANKLATIMSMKNRYYDPKDLAADNEHMNYFGLSNKEEYIRLANSFVNKPKYIFMNVHHMMNGDNQLQFSFLAEGGYIVVVRKGI